MRLIDADALKERMGDEHFQNYGYAIMMVLDAPTVEAAPVIHAAWKWGLNRYKQHGAWCTNCGCGWEYKPGDFDRVQGLVNAHKYCPNCGAKMDK